MNAIGTPMSAKAAIAGGAGSCDRYIVRTASAVCGIRARTIAPIAEVLGFESEMDVVTEGLVDPSAVLGAAADGETIADLLDSRMIAPPRPRRRRQRPVSSRALFYGTSGR